MKTLILVILLVLVGCGKNDGSFYTVKGDKGDPGQSIVGPAGSPGLNGSNGQDASPITSVQLCGSCHASYPSTFPEIGLCINDKLYGVYSANGGFMVEIIPGTYSSNGINCTCTLVVSAHCVVH